jgi:hypothetical protein
MVDDRLSNPLPLRPLQSAQQNERQQTELRRDYELNQHYDQEQLRKREEFVKQQYGDRLPLIIEQRCDVQDEHIKSIAADYLAKNIAAYVGTLEQNVLTKLAEDSAAQAYEFDDLQRDRLKQETTQQQKQRRDEQSRLQREPRQGRYYAELHETHRTVGEEIESARAAQAESPRNERIEPHHRSRYAELDDTQNRVEVERAQRDGSSPLNRAEREAKEAEVQTADGEMTDTKAAGANRRLDRALALSREFGSHFDREDGNERDGDDGGRSR